MTDTPEPRGPVTLCISCTIRFGAYRLVLTETEANTCERDSRGNLHAYICPTNRSTWHVTPVKDGRVSLID